MRPILVTVSASYEPGIHGIKDCSGGGVPSLTDYVKYEIYDVEQYPKKYKFQDATLNINPRSLFLELLEALKCVPDFACVLENSLAIGLRPLLLFRC